MERRDDGRHVSPSGRQRGFAGWSFATSGTWPRCRSTCPPRGSRWWGITGTERPTCSRRSTTSTSSGRCVARVTWSWCGSARRVSTWQRRCDERAVGQDRRGFERQSGRRRILLDGVPCDRVSDALGALPSVAFSPADVVARRRVDRPARRRWLDVTLASTSPRYLTALRDYRAALAQRNAALRARSRQSPPRSGTAPSPRSAPR